MAVFNARLHEVSVDMQVLLLGTVRCEHILKYMQGPRACDGLLGECRWLCCCSTPSHLYVEPSIMDGDCFFLLHQPQAGMTLQVAGIVVQILLKHLHIAAALRTIRET